MNPPSSDPSLLGAAAALAKPVAATLKPLTRFTPIGSTFVDWAMLPERPTANGTFRAVIDAPAPTLERFELHVTTLNPGKTPHAPHFHPWEEILILKEGSLEVSINGETRPAAAGAVIFFAANDPHTVVNASGAPATYYVINFHAAAAHGVRGEPAADWAPADRLRSSVVDWDQGTLKEGTHDSRRIFIDSATVTLTSLKVHATTAAARRYPVRHGGHLNLLLVIVKEGVVESTLDGVTHLVGPGSLIVLAPGAVQTIRNPGDTPATYYVLAPFTEETPRGA